MNLDMSFPVSLPNWVINHYYGPAECPVFVLHNGRVYVLWNEHLSDESNEPGVGRQWDWYWIDYGSFPTISYRITANDVPPILVWTQGRYYYSGEQVMHNRVIYQCIQSHSASSANEPGVGEDWEDSWRRPRC